MTNRAQTWAWIGAGAVARRYVPGLQAMVRAGRLGGLRVFDVNAEAASAWCRELQQHHIDARAAGARLPWSGVQACVIATPPQHHIAGIREAFDFGLPVLCEKPVIGTPQELKTLDGWIASGAGLMPSQKYRYATPVQEAVAYLRSGALGPVHRLAARFVSHVQAPVGWRTQAKGGGVWMDNAPHALDLLQSFWAASRGRDWDEAEPCIDLAHDRVQAVHWLRDAQAQSQDVLVKWHRAEVSCSVELAWGRQRDEADGVSLPQRDVIFEAEGSSGSLQLHGQGWQHLDPDGRLMHACCSSYDGAAAFAAVLGEFQVFAESFGSRPIAWSGWRNYSALTELLLHVHEDQV